jgi:FkbM family methyltransferase
MAELSGTLLGVKHRTKVWIRALLQTFGTSVLFPGERSPQYLREFVHEFYLRQCHGILHLGANTGGEASFYSSLGKRVVWVEGDPEVFKVLLKNIELYENQEAICALLSDKSELLPFYIADNNGLSSSIHPISKSNDKWSFRMVPTKYLRSKQLDDLSIREVSDLDFWIIDVQGHEFEVLLGASKSMNWARWTLVEISTKQLYENQRVFQDVDALLATRGFVRLHEPMDEHCEVLYMRPYEKMSDNK